MAPGSYGGYGSHDSLRGEIGVNVLKRKQYYQEVHLDGDCQRSLVGDLQKDGRQREYIKWNSLNVIDTFDLNGSNGKMQGVGWVSKTFVDEPGELSSEESSVIEDGVNGSEDKNEGSSGKKRKFSSIEWAMEDKESSVLKQKTINNERPPVTLRAHPSQPQKSFKPMLVKKVRKSEDLLASSDLKGSIDSIRVLQLKNDDFAEQIEEDYVPVCTISLSRWADVTNSFEDDEVGTSDVEFSSNMRKNILLAPGQGPRPAPGEVIFREGSEGFASKASRSGGLCREACLEPMEDGIDDLVVCADDSNEEVSEGLLEEGCRVRTLHSVKQSYRTINMLQCCRTVDEFDKLYRINEGTYGIVCRARDKRTGEIVALKKVKMEKEREGFPLNSLREINVLLSLHHTSIVDVKEVVVDRDLDGVFIVMEYMEHDLKGLIETMKKPFHLSEVKCLMLQLLTGVKHLHDNWVLHRDLKTSNLLYNNRGELKICDFGLSRQYGSPLKPYTQLVVTLWYRAPELLLGAKDYSTAIDMWSLGCIMAELLTKEPLFPGKSELDQLDKIFRILGTPWPGFTRLPGAKVDFVKKPFKLREKFPRMSPTPFLGRSLLSDAGFNLLNKLLTYDPKMRITAEDALNHPWFCESPLPMAKDFMPTFPAQHRRDRHQQKI